MDLLKKRNKVTQFSQQTVWSYNCVTLNWKQTIHAQGPWYYPMLRTKVFIRTEFTWLWNQLLLTAPSWN